MERSVQFRKHLIQWSLGSSSQNAACQAPTILAWGPPVFLVHLRASLAPVTLYHSGVVGQTLNWNHETAFPQYHYTLNCHVSDDSIPKGIAELVVWVFCVGILTLIVLFLAFWSLIVLFNLNTLLRDILGAP